jgi:hypothetical protein
MSYALHYDAIGDYMRFQTQPGEEGGKEGTGRTFKYSPSLIV